jgi:hypothetical protein
VQTVNVFSHRKSKLRESPGFPAMTEKEIVLRSLTELAAEVEKHRRLVKTVLQGESLPEACLWNECHHQKVLIGLIAETVQVLEETRKSFKSRQLEQLRKRLLEVLHDEAHAPTGSELLAITQ